MLHPFALPIEHLLAELGRVRRSAAAAGVAARALEPPPAEAEIDTGGNSVVPDQRSDHAGRRRPRVQHHQVHAVLVREPSHRPVPLAAESEPGERWDCLTQLSGALSITVVRRFDCWRDHPRETV